MELTLIPIAAILVLLAGLASPAQPALEALPSTALLSIWLRGDRKQQPTTRQLRSASTQKHALHPATKQDVDTPAQHALRVCRNLGRSLLRTRFGIAGGAYRSTAPPLRA